MWHGKGREMTEFQMKEKQLHESDECKFISSVSDKEVKKLLSKAAVHTKKKDWVKTAVIYAALATKFDSNANYALAAARQYRMASCIDDSARWFLKSAEIFAKQMHATKAISALRVFEQLKPDVGIEHTQHIYDLCKESLGAEVSYLNIMPDKKNQQPDSSSFRDTDLFSAFDEADFDVLFKSLKHRKLKDKQVLARMGEEATCLYIVVSGNLSAFITSNNKRKALGEVQGHHICGLIPYFTGGGRAADFVANGEAEVLELSYHQLNLFKARLPAFSEQIETIYEEHLLIRQLAISEVFESESLATRRWVAARMKPVYLDKGGTLFKEGQISQGLFLVRFGELKVSLSVKENEHFTKNIVSGGVAGETSIVTNNKRTATVRALNDCVLMELSAEDYNVIYKQSESLRKTLQRIRQAQAAEVIGIIKTARVIKGDQLNVRLFEDVWQEHVEFLKS